VYGHHAVTAALANPERKVLRLAQAGAGELPVVEGHEWEQVPRDVLVICLGKSTYARCGIIVNVTPLEPEWEGHVTLEFSNTTPLPAKIYANEGACQFLFLKGEGPCETSYRDRAGKYMKQTGVTLPRL
jgi:dCTP deaminase